LWVFDQTGASRAIIRSIASWFTIAMTWRSTRSRMRVASESGPHSS
jgi:hypothetical protein